MKHKVINAGGRVIYAGTAVRLNDGGFATFEGVFEPSRKEGERRLRRRTTVALSFLNYYSSGTGLVPGRTIFHCSGAIEVEPLGREDMRTYRSRVAEAIKGNINKEEYESEENQGGCDSALEDD